MQMVFRLLLFVILTHSLYGYATEESIRHYQEEFCKDMSIQELTTRYNRAKAKLDNYIQSGAESCKNAGDTIKVAEAKREGRRLYDECESYRYGKIRKEIHKLKIETKALSRELKLRKK